MKKIITSLLLVLLLVSCNVITSPISNEFIVEEIDKYGKCCSLYTLSRLTDASDMYLNNIKIIDVNGAFKINDTLKITISK